MAHRSRRYNTQGVGNPLLIAAAASKVGESIVTRAPAITRGIRTVLGVSGAALLVYFGYKGIKKWNQNRLMQKVATDVNARAAMDIYNAIPEGLKKSKGGLFNPAGLITDLYSQVERIWTSTDSERILEIAKRITNTKDCFHYFQVIYGEDLYTLLSKALTEDQLDVFMNVVKTGSYSKTIRPKQGLYIYTTKGVTVRKTAEKKDNTMFSFGNKVANVPAGKILGRTTGQEPRDNKNNVIYIEFNPFININKLSDNSISKQNIYAWKDALKFYTKDEMEAEFGMTLPKIFQKYLYRFDESDLSGFKNQNELSGFSKHSALPANTKGDYEYYS